MKSKLITILLTGACLSLAHADYNPVALTPSSFTYAIVIPSNAPAAAGAPSGGGNYYGLTATAGAGTSLGDNSFFEEGMIAQKGYQYFNLGIPVHNTVFTNVNNSSMAFLMPPDYTTNNDLQVDGSTTSGTFYLATPTNATSLAILCTSGGGGNTINYTVTHTNGSTETGTFNIPDWFTGGSTVAWGANARSDVNGNFSYYSFGANTDVPYLYGITINVSGASPVSSVTFNYGSGGEGNFYALSSSTDGTHYTPAPVNGFNQIATIANIVPLYLTATMDEGTNFAYNNLNTWFEQGYAVGSPSDGLPPSGSTFTSQSYSTHHYQMGNYHANNAILVDAGHLVANITPAVLAPYSSFALLTAGGNIGGNNVMTNICVLQHQDGVNETNLFYGYDWYNGAIPPAWIANGRVNMEGRSLNTLGGGNPKLFESFFVLSDTASPVTNIQVMYETAPGGSATTFIMAVSASAGGVPPIVTSGALPASQSWFPTQKATFSVLATGTAPVTNSWLVQSNGVWVSLINGVDANGSTISGANTTTLTISNLSAADVGQYEYIAANALGSATSSPAILDIKGVAGVVPISGWTNIANATYPVGTSTAIFASNGVTSAILTLSDAGVNNAWNSGLTGDQGNGTLMHGYIDAGSYGGIDAIATVSNLTDSAYDVYLYCMPDQTRPSGATDGLPNYAVNGTTNYAPLLGATGASTYDATTNSVGGTGFSGFVQAATIGTNDFNQDLSVSSFGNYIKIASVTPVGGAITIQAEADPTTYRSSLNGIELVSTSNDGQDFGIHFLGNVTDTINVTPVAPIIDSQTPASSFSVLTNHAVTTIFSLVIDASSAPPFRYQWYTNGTPVPSGTNATYANVDTSPVTIYCAVTNFVGGTVSTPVSISINAKPALTPYQTAVFAYNPVAYWPLTETSGNIAFDYAGTNDGTYTGAFTLGNSGIPPSFGTGGANLAAGFDGSSAYVDVGVGDLNITGPITVIQWVQPSAGGDTGFTTTIGHSDQGWRLDDVGGQPHWADAGPDVVSAATINDGNWHQLVGVYDGTNQYLYVDGQRVGTPLAGSPPQGSTDDVRIGGAPDYGNRFFAGDICEVAVLPVALKSTQVTAIYAALDTAPVVSITPASPSVYSGVSVTLTANLSGTPATSLQWFYIDTSNNSNNIAGATNTTYTIPETPLAYDGYQFGINAANAYGNTSTEVTLAVQSVPAFLVGDISPLIGEAYVGAPVTYSVNAQGSLPINYQWFVDSVAVPGATNASYMLPAECGTNSIYVQFTNSASAGTPVVSSTAWLQGDSSPTNLTFNTDGTGWQLNPEGGSVPTLVNNVLELTDGGSGEASSAFYMTPQYVGRFTASFTYTATNASADGATFVIQNAAAGAAALGGGGGELGYYGISNSVALEINLYPLNGEVPGIAAGTNGNTYATGGAEYATPGQIDTFSGDPINVTVNWVNGVMSVALLDTVTLHTFSTNYAYGPLPAFLNGSDLGYVGFTGGDGGATSIQTISNFSFESVITPVSLAVSPLAANSFTISWPSADPSYQLQTNSSLTTPSWGPGPMPVVVGGVNQATVQVTGSTPTLFYRLVRVVCQ